MISILFGGEPNPAENLAEKDADPPEKCGYGVQPTVDWPATDPSTIKGRLFDTGRYPADPYLEDNREDESYEHEKNETPEYEKKEHK